MRWVLRYVSACVVLVAGVHGSDSITDNLIVYAGRLQEYLKNDFNSHSDYQMFADAFAEANTASGDYKHGGRLYSIVNIEDIMESMKQQVMDIAQKAEESYYLTDPAENTSFYDGDLEYFSIQGSEVLNNSSRVLKLSKDKDPLYGINVNPESSVVRVAIDMYKGDPRVRHDIKITSKLERLFQKNHNRSLARNNAFVFQQFGTQYGVTRVFPAHHFAEFRYTPKGTREYYDGRDRVWYVEAVSPPKDIIFMIDFSGSMDGLAQNIAKNLLKVIFHHTPSYDYINVVVINRKPSLPSKCFQSTLEKATKEIKRHLLDSLDDFKNEKRANFTEALKLAFDVFERSEKEGKTNGCTKTLVIISDGDVAQYKEVFDEKNRQVNGKKVRVIAFRTETTMERNVLETDHKKDEAIISLACGSDGQFVRLQDNHMIFDALRIYTDFFVPTKQEYSNSSHDDTAAELTKWTSMYESYPNTGPTVTLVHPVIVSKSYNYSVDFPRYRQKELYSGRKIVHEERMRAKTEGLPTRLLGVAAVDYPIFREYRRDNVLSNYVRVITMKGEYVMSHPDITSIERQFEFLQIERGTDMEKLKGIQTKSAHRHDIFYRNINTYLEPSNTPLGREIIVDTYYMLTPVKNTPFTVGLSLPVLSNFQYQFKTLYEIDQGRTTLLAYKQNIIFKAFLDGRCKATDDFFDEEEIGTKLRERILGTLNGLNSTSVAIPKELLCIYDVYLNALMEGYIMKEILAKWIERQKNSHPDETKLYFHSVGGNIFLTPQRDISNSYIYDPKSDVMFAKALADDPVDLIYVSLGRIVDDTNEINFNISKRVLLPRSSSNSVRVAGILTAQRRISSLQQRIKWISKELLTDKIKVLYILDEFGYVVFTVAQHNQKIKVETFKSFHDSDILSSYYNDTIRMGENLTFFGEIQPWIMEQLVRKNYYSDRVLDRCRQSCEKEEDDHQKDDKSASARQLGSALKHTWLFLQQFLRYIFSYSLISLLSIFKPTAAEVAHYGLSKTPDFCCTAHRIFKKNFHKTQPTHVNCIARPNNHRSDSCCTKSIYVQPINGTNLLLVLDTNRDMTCVQSISETADRKNCPCYQQHSHSSQCTSTCLQPSNDLKPITNKDPTLVSNLTACRYNYTKVNNSLYYPCLERSDHTCSRGRRDTTTPTSFLLVVTLTHFIITVAIRTR